jgi:outer membrane protein OmpA-like peptidoglycan-associated protein
MRTKGKSAFLPVTGSMMLIMTVFPMAGSAAPMNEATSAAAAATPSTTMWATRGLTQTASAEPMGEGRLTFCMTGTWYRQKLGFNGTVPPQNADITTGIGAFSFGVNAYIDVFAWAAGYGLLTTKNDFGQGSAGGGIRGSLPLPEKSPVYLAMEMSVIGGTASNQINNNFPDGYNYFETRIGYDFMGKIIETLALGDDSFGIKFHFNEGIVKSTQADHGNLLLLAGGMQAQLHPLFVLGMEANSRTTTDKINVRTDPLWLTPSLIFKTPYYFDVCIGSDISLSNDRTAGTAVRALESYRVFGGITFSFDFLAANRRAAREKEQRDSAEKVELKRKVLEEQVRYAKRDRKAYIDSLACIKTRTRADSLAQKINDDSIALAEMVRKLDEERSRRSDAEKQLLSTGLLLLDAVYFESGKAQISINSLPYLKIIGKMLVKYPKLQIEVAGHTDNIGKYEYNMTLSQARAEAVRQYLIQVAPELLNRLSAQGYGLTQPKAPNTTADGRKMNRRVELQVLNKEMLKEYN